MTEALFRPGDLIENRYRLLRPLGAGGMAEVWQARPEVLGRDIAIKLVRGVDPATAQRLYAEARALARLSHPAIVAVFDAGLAKNETPYLALELVQGESLEARLERGPLGPKAAASLVAAICDGLTAAHAASIVHRDIKPSNILLPADSPHAPRIVDFGVAALTAGLEPRLTRAGAVIGTPAYMAPEQLKSEPPDARTDVWAAVVTLYEAAFGRLPFQADDIRALATLVLTREPARPPDATDARFWGIIRRGLEKDRAERYASAQALASSLRWWLAGLESEADASGAEEVAPIADSFDALVKRRFS